MVLRRLDGNGREKHQGDPGLTVLWSPYLSLLLTRGGGLVVSLAIDLAVEFSKTSQLADAFARRTYCRAFRNNRRDGHGC